MSERAYDFTVHAFSVGQSSVNFQVKVGEESVELTVHSAHLVWTPFRFHNQWRVGLLVLCTTCNTCDTHAIRTVHMHTYDTHAYVSYVHAYA